jgi:hypothetical protein
MTQTASRLLIIASLAITTAACSTTGDGGGARLGGGGDNRGDRAVPNLFISPAGRPYRAEHGLPYPVAEWFAAADADHDGHLTRAEFRADAAAFFKELDANHDGLIDGFEVQRYEKEVAPEINPEVDGLRFGEGMDLALGTDQGGAHGPKIGRGPRFSSQETAGDRRPEGAGLFGLLNEPEPVAASDARFDGHITLQEFLDAADRRFTALDKKNLGYLTLDALPKTPVQVLIERKSARQQRRTPPK